MFIFIYIEIRKKNAQSSAEHNHHIIKNQFLSLRFIDSYFLQKKYLSLSALQILSYFAPVQATIKSFIYKILSLSIEPLSISSTRSFISSYDNSTGITLSIPLTLNSTMDSPSNCPSPS